MLIGVFQTVATVLIVLTYYVVDFILMAHYDRDRAKQKSGRNWKFTLFALTVAAILILQPLLWPGLSLNIQASWGIWIQVLGIALASLGLVVHVWSRIHLGQFYAERVEVIAGHQVIDTGPYAYVRHPIISSFFLLVTGLALINPALPTVLLVIYTFWDFSGAARKEEQKLSQLPGYPAYMQRTSRFFPRVRQVIAVFRKT
jgi:protein-S-isoprenylcysteine O-methyltransferase Ste14